MTGISQYERPGVAGRRRTTVGRQRIDDRPNGGLLMSVMRPDRLTRHGGLPIRLTVVALGIWGALVGIVSPSGASVPARASVTANSSIGTLLATLRDPRQSLDHFGNAVAVSGKTAIVGAPAFSYPTFVGPGAAYIYWKGSLGWRGTQRTLLRDPAAASGFGFSVGLSGNTAIVGGFGEAAYLYTKGASGWPAKPSVTLHSPFGQGGLFGLSVAVSGTTAIVGAPNNSGRAFLYEKGPSGWPTTPSAVLADPIAHEAGTNFGVSVAVSNGTAVVGAWQTTPGGVAYLYSKGASGWPTTPTAKWADPGARTGDKFGFSVAVSGTTAVIGAQNANVGGAAYIYSEGVSGWPTPPTVTLDDPAKSANDVFGISVGVSGPTAIVGGASTTSGDVACLYVKGTSAWPTAPSGFAHAPRGAKDFGFSAAVSGLTGIVGAGGTANGVGSAYIYSA